MDNRTSDTSLLIGVLVDVSGSMRSSIGSSGSSATNRLEAFSSALEDMVKRAASTVQEHSKEQRSTEARLFVYGFGFGNPISAFLGRKGPDVRDLFAPDGVGERTLSVLDLAGNWQQHLRSIRTMAVDMFGSTPMRAAMQLAKRRLADEIQKRPVTSVLFLLSDGEPTDGDSATILAIAGEIRSLGTIIVSCFVTETDIIEPRRLYGQPQSSWPQAARLMFECASELPLDTAFDAQLREYGWNCDPQCHLFAHVNQSEMLSEFLNVAVSPLREEAQGTASDQGQLTERESTLPLPPVTTPPNAPSSRTSKARLLFLHGLGGSAEPTWGRFPEFLMADPDLAQRYDVGFFSFPTTLFRLPFSARAPKIQELAKGLRTQILHDEFERVDLVCHSLGGLVARRYLIEEVKANRPLRVDRVALIAVPNNGAGLASAAQFVSWRQNQIKQLCKDADIIEFLNEDWFRFDVQNKLKAKFIVGTQDEVVDRHSVAGYWGNLDVETIIGSGHVDIVKPGRPDDLVVKVLKRFLLD
jgi:hypothetical protein